MANLVWDVDCCINQDKANEVTVESSNSVSNDKSNQEPEKVTNKSNEESTSVKEDVVGWAANYMKWIRETLMKI